MEGVAVGKSRHQRLPGAPVRPYCPQAPHPRIPQPLRLIRAEGNPAIGQLEGVQCRAERHRCNGRDVRAVLVHHKELRRERGVVLHRPELVPGGGEDDFAPRHRTGTRVHHAVGQRRDGDAGVRGGLLEGQSHDLPGGHMDPVNVEPGTRQAGVEVLRVERDIWRVAVVDPLAIKTDARIDHRTECTARYQHLLRAIRVQQHQVGIRLRPERVEHVRPLRVDGIAVAGSTDIDDVVGNAHGGWRGLCERSRRQEQRDTRKPMAQHGPGCVTSFPRFLSRLSAVRTCKVDKPHKTNLQPGRLRPRCG